MGRLKAYVADIETQLFETAARSVGVIIGEMKHTTDVQKLK